MASPETGLITAGASPAPLSSVPITAVAYTIKAPSGNSGTVYVGPAAVTTSTGFPLDPGESFDYFRNDQLAKPALQVNVQDWYAVGNGTDKVAWVASP